MTRVAGYPCGTGFAVTQSVFGGSAVTAVAIEPIVPALLVM